jgi:hypothetical protein
MRVKRRVLGKGSVRVCTMAISDLHHNSTGAVSVQQSRPSKSIRGKTLHVNRPKPQGDGEEVVVVLDSVFVSLLGVV